MREQGKRGVGEEGTGTHGWGKGGRRTSAVRCVGFGGRDWGAREAGEASLVEVVEGPGFSSFDCLDELELQSKANQNTKNMSLQ